MTLQDVKAYNSAKSSQNCSLPSKNSCKKSTDCYQCQLADSMHVGLLTDSGFAALCKLRYQCCVGVLFFCVYQSICCGTISHKNGYITAVSGIVYVLNRTNITFAFLFVASTTDVSRTARNNGMWQSRSIYHVWCREFHDKAGEI